MNDGETFHAAAAIRPGWELLLPTTTQPTNGQAAGTSQDPGTVTVRPGDTLSGIASRHLGGASWQALAAANPALTDPDHIEPGWVLQLPTATPTAAPSGHTNDGESESETSPKGGAGAGASDGSRDGDTEHEGRTPQTDPGNPSGTGSGAAEPGSQGSVPAGRSRNPGDGTRRAPDKSPASSAEAPSSDSDVVERQDSETGPSGEAPPAWMMVGLTGGGVLLAGGLFLGLRARRRAQFRHRRPGRAITNPDPSLVTAEMSVHTAGRSSAELVERLDAEFHRIGAWVAEANAANAEAGAVGGGYTMPAIAAAEITDDATTLHLSTPGQLPEGWTPTADQLHWTRPNTDLIDTGARVDQAPYPLMVSVGETLVEVGETPAVWLVNLEELGALSIGGDPERARDFARHLAAQVAVQPWSRDVTVDLVGIAEETTGLGDRVRYRPATAATEAAQETIADAVATSDRVRECDTDTATARTGSIDDDLWPARLLVIDVPDVPDLPEDPDQDAGADPTASTSGQLTQLAGLIQTQIGQTSTALVVAGAAELPDDVDAHQVTITHDGVLTMPDVGLRLRAVTLSRPEARDCAMLFEASDALADQPMPVTTGVEGFESLVDVAGGIRTDQAAFAASATTAAAAAPRAHIVAVSELASARAGSGLAAVVATAGSESGKGSITEGRTEPIYPTPVVTPPQASEVPGDTATDEADLPDEVAEVAAGTEDLSRDAIGVPGDAAATQVPPAVVQDVAGDVAAVPEETRQRIEDETANLDSDVADWFDDDCPRPKISALGPVMLAANGKRPSSRAYYIELAIYLALHRAHGASKEQVQDAMGCPGDRVRKDMAILREWLGGYEQIPDARKSPAAKQRGLNVYQFSDRPLFDYELFRQLRARGEARGGKRGQRDLLTAMQLVRGVPFDQRRPGGYEWLATGQRYDDYASYAVSDVAAVAATRLLQAAAEAASVGDVDKAATARKKALTVAQIASEAVPADETSHLLRAAAEDDEISRERILRDLVVNRSDLGGAPEDLPDRTEQILRQNKWLAS